jgi:hypothetical protein
MKTNEMIIKEVITNRYDRIIGTMTENNRIAGKKDWATNIDTKSVIDYIIEETAKYPKTMKKVGTDFVIVEINKKLKSDKYI